MFVSMMVFVFFMTACASTETAQNPSESKSSDDLIDLPCSEFLNGDSGSVASLGQASGAKMRAASLTTSAIASARAQMAQNMKGAYRGLVSDYMKNIGLNNKTDVEDKIEKAGDQIIDAKIPYTQVVCQKSRKIDDETIATFVVIKMSTTEALKNISESINTNLTPDERAMIEYDEMKFRERMEKGLAAYFEAEKAKQENYKKSQEEKKEEK